MINQVLTKRFTPCAVALACAVFLNACTTTAQECDPSVDPGFFNKIGCVVSGSYDERVEIKKQQLADLKAENERLNALIRSIQQKQGALQANYQSRQRELDRINDELGRLRSSLSSKKALSSKLNTQLNETKAQIEEMKKTPANATLLQKQTEVDELEAQLEEIRQQITAM